MCTSRRRREFGLLRISASSSREMTLAYSDRGPDVSMGSERMQTGIANHGLVAGSRLRSKWPIATGLGGAAPPTKVYERSEPLAPSPFICQLSLALEPIFDS